MTQDKRDTFNAGDFSSRKLIDIVTGDQGNDRVTLDQEALNAVVSELTSRRHYLSPAGPTQKISRPDGSRARTTGSDLCRLPSRAT